MKNKTLKSITILSKALELQKVGEFSIRTCWECNSGHEHLKKVDGLFMCFGCGQWYINGDSLDNIKHCKKPYKPFVKLET